MPGVRVENSPSFADRKRDITAWQEGDISALRARTKKRYQRRKGAVIAYYTTDTALEYITSQYHISAEILLKLVDKCTLRHPDGGPWGFRALAPGVNVVEASPAQATGIEDPGERQDKKAEMDRPPLEDPSTGSALESSSLTAADDSTIVLEGAEEEEHDTAKHETLTLPAQAAVVPETPYPLFMDSGDEEILFAEEYAAAVNEDAGDEEERLAAGERACAEETQEPTAKLPRQPCLSGSDIVVDAAQSFSPAEEVTASQMEQTDAARADAAGAARLPATESGQAPEEAHVSHDAEDAIAEAQRIMVKREEDHAGRKAQVEGLMPLTRASHSTGTAVVEAPSLIVPVTPARHTYVATKRVVQRRLVRKHWQRDAQGLTHNKRVLKIVSLAALIAVLLFVLVPMGAGMAAYGAYSNISGIAHDGVDHLLKVKSLLNVSKTDITSALDATKLQQARLEFRAAEDDFSQLQQLVDRPDVQEAITQFAPQYSNKLTMARSLVQVALDVARMGNELSGVGLIGANIIHGSPLAATASKPLLSTADVEAIDGAMAHALYYISDIQARMSTVSLKDLPLSDAQKRQIASLLPLLPRARAAIVQAQGLMGLLTWLLGVGQPRRYLIQTMDRAELRPGGGFTGQYGVLQIQNGRMSPLSLSDVTLIDYAENGTAIGRQAPPGYSWMNFGNFGVRDSNLSADFPTTARITMQLFSEEGGGPLDGDIAFTPVLISNILRIIGPIKVPGYNETITPQNLEERLHYYQQDPLAIAREKQISGDYSHAGRKAFTSGLAKMLLDRVRHLKPNGLIKVAQSALKSIQSRDLEMYFADPVAENWLVQHGYSGSIDTFSQQDGFMVVQSNLSISKASQYVHTTEQDQVSLDASGGATHNLTITLNYQQTGPVYGYDTYADYIRVYAPAVAQFLGGSGFDSGHAICTPAAPAGTHTTTATTAAPPSSCSGDAGSFNGARDCPDGNYTLGMDGELARPWPVDSLGPPTSLSSDLPGRAMFGGMTETPKNCISTITLSWYVPHAVHKVNGQPVYPILVQKQSGLTPTLELSIDSSAFKGLPSYNFTGDISVDKAFTVMARAKKE